VLGGLFAGTDEHKLFIGEASEWAFASFFGRKSPQDGSNSTFCRQNNVKNFPPF
jgi:hypothetical protein